VVLDFQEHPVPPFHVRRNGNRVFIAFGPGLKTDKGIEEFASQQGTGLSAPAAPELLPAAVAGNTSGKDTKNQFGAVASQGGGIQAEQFVLSPSQKGSQDRRLQSAKNDSAGAKKKLTDPLGPEYDMKKSPPPPGGPGGKVESELKGNGPIAAPIPAQPNDIPGGGGQMVKEVRPPVTRPLLILVSWSRR